MLSSFRESIASGAHSNNVFSGGWRAYKRAGFTSRGVSSEQCMMSELADCIHILLFAILYPPCSVNRDCIVSMDQGNNRSNGGFVSMRGGVES